MRQKEKTMLGVIASLALISGVNNHLAAQPSNEGCVSLYANAKEGKRTEGAIRALACLQGEIAALRGQLNGVEHQAENSARKAIKEELNSSSRVKLFKEETHAATIAARLHKQAEDAATQGQLKRVEIEQDAIRAAEALTARTAEINDLIDVSGIEGKIDEAFADPEFRADVVRRVLPVGAVVAFDRQGGCPVGWSAMESASGRFLVAAGKHENLDELGEKLSIYETGDSGGVEKHPLKVTEMPKHKHILFGDTITGAENARSPKSDEYVAVTGEAPAFKESDYNYFMRQAGTVEPPKHGLSGVAGSGIAHNNMPPYIALQFCKKMGAG